MLRLRSGAQAMLAADFPGVMDDHGSLQPERRLMLTVLRDALGAFRKHALASDTPGRRSFREAEEWLASEDVAWPFSFSNVCEELGIDGPSLRRTLWRWRAEQTRAEGSPLQWLRRFRADERAAKQSRS